MIKWKLINTAPRDGTQIIGAHIWTMPDRVRRASWVGSGFLDESGDWSFDFADLDAEEYSAPTHWIDVPEETP